MSAPYEAFLFFLPIYLSNMLTYMMFSRLGLGVPVDGGVSFRGKRLIGNSRGLSGFMSSLAIGAFWGVLSGQELECVHLVVGAKFGTLINSAIKRRLGFVEGSRFFPLDQLDFFLGGALFAHLYSSIPMSTFLWGAGITIVLHLTVNGMLRLRWERFLYKV